MGRATQHVPKNPVLRSLVFDKIYPANASAYDTELYEDLG